MAVINDRERVLLLERTKDEHERRLNTINGSIEGLREDVQASHASVTDHIHHIRDRLGGLESGQRMMIRVGGAIAVLLGAELLALVLR